MRHQVALVALLHLHMCPTMAQRPEQQDNGRQLDSASRNSKHRAAGKRHLASSGCGTTGRRLFGAPKAPTPCPPPPSPSPSPPPLPFSITLTTCGAAGRYGPTQSDCDSAYGSSGVVTVGTGADEGYQTWTVPKTGTYRITAKGATGGYPGDYGTNYPGRGAIMRGDFVLNQGDTLTIVVGQAGGDGHSPGGGSKSGGGGGTFIVKGTRTSPNPVLLVAGGGGGAVKGMNHRVLGDGDAGTDASILTSGQIAGYSSFQYTGGEGGASGGGGKVTSSGGGCGSGGGGGLTGNGIDGGTTGSKGGKAFVNGAAGSAWSTTNSGDGGFGGGSGGNDSCVTSSGAGGGYSGGGGARHNGSGGGGGSYNSGTNPLDLTGDQGNQPGSAGRADGEVHIEDAP